MKDGRIWERFPEFFAEYNSRDAQGNVLDLSKRKTEYQYKDRQTGKEVSGTCQATITKEEADKYTYENMIPGNDGWNPRIMMEKLGSPRSLVYQQGTLKWNPVKNAIGYIVYDGEQILGTTTDTSFPVSEVNYALKVSAVNQYGTQGKKRCIVIEYRKLVRKGEVLMRHLPFFLLYSVGVTPMIF